MSETNAAALNTPAVKSRQAESGRAQPAQVIDLPGPRGAPYAAHKLLEILRCDLAGSTLAEYAVLACLIAHTSATSGRSSLYVRTIANRIKANRTTVVRALDGLAKRGLIEKTRRRGASGFRIRKEWLTETTGGIL